MALDPRELPAYCLRAPHHRFINPRSTMSPEEIDQLWDYQHPDTSESRFRALLSDPSLEPSSRAEILTQIARAQGLQGNFDTGHHTLDEAESLLLPGASRFRARSLLERGRLHNSAGAPETAKPLFLAALELATKTKEDFYAIDAAHMLGIIGTPVHQIFWNRHALDLTHNSLDPRAKRWLAPITNNLAWTLFDTADYPAALDLFTQSLNHHQLTGNAQNIRIAKWSIAKTLRHLNRLDESLAIQRALKDELTTLGETDPYVDEELVELGNLLSSQ
jgi:tetratricopeptide (TPR) repeat protein